MNALRQEVVAILGSIDPSAANGLQLVLNKTPEGANDIADMKIISDLLTSRLSRHVIDTTDIIYSLNQDTVNYLNWKATFQTVVAPAISGLSLFSYP